MKKCRSRMKRVLCLGAMVLMSQGALIGCGGKSGTEISDFASYAQEVERIEIPEDVRIVALGEATHGNKEFQELKLDVFAHLVETTSVKGFALEGDFGGCALANRYILYDEGTAEEAVKKLGFQIYRTDQMLELVQWMHDYNLEASPENKVRFYGFDMQRDLNSLKLIQDFYQVVDSEKATVYSEPLAAFYGDEEYSYDKSDLPEMERLLKDIVKDLEENEAGYAVKDEEAYAYALQGAKCLLQNMELQGAGSNYSQIRDKNMTENVKWILEREENIYGSQLMISGHNGHVAKIVNSTYTNMGSYLFDEMGEEYFVIGTDFYNTTCNLPEGDGRSDFEFCSDDPLAEAVGGMEENIYYLDFADARESKELSELIDASIPTGSLGENYSPMMKVMKSTYQINIAPGKLYDGMILVHEATPIQVWDYMEK